MFSKGTITLMGSGELTASMVEIHKMLIAKLKAPANITFVDTPAGFQANADQISAGAVAYFKNRVQQQMEVASYKSHKTVTEVDAALALQKLRESDYILMGPGSPTYTLDQLRPTAIPDILQERVLSGACLTAASAAALTMGKYTLPVYEIYKVGSPLHWLEGFDMLARFGLDLVVVPHWNNAEGGTHDTSRCFMGEERFTRLMDMLEEQIPILGLDEHTACIIDLAADTFQVRGIGKVVLLNNTNGYEFLSGTTHPLAILRGETTGSRAPSHGLEFGDAETKTNTEQLPGEETGFWQNINGLEEQCRSALQQKDYKKAVATLLLMDEALWRAQREMNDPDTLAEAHALFRELIVLLGTRPALHSEEITTLFAPVVEKLLSARNHLRDAGEWSQADAIRDALSDAGIVLEDGKAGSKWRMDNQREVNDDTPS